MSSSSCTQQLQQFADEVNRFEALLYASLLLTVANSVATRVLIGRGMALQKLAYYLWTTGGIKVILAVTIFSIIPTCPSGCKCVGGHMNPLTAAILLLVGLAWLYRGYKAYKLSKTIAAGNCQERRCRHTRG